MNQRIINSKDKVVGAVKETAGKILDNDEMEFKGKMQSMKANLGNRMEDVAEKLEDKVEDIADDISNGIKKLGSKMEDVKSTAYSKANEFIHDK